MYSCAELRPLQTIYTNFQMMTGTISVIARTASAKPWQMLLRRLFMIKPWIVLWLLFDFHTGVNNLLLESQPRHSKMFRPPRCISRQQ